MDDPDLVEEMVAHVSQLAQTLLPPVLEVAQFDAAGGWEDICYNGGPLLSPASSPSGSYMAVMRSCASTGSTSSGPTATAASRN
jgi:hypothetical protein